MAAKVIPDTDIDHIVERYLSGESIKSIADSYGCGFKAVLRRLHKRGVNMRGRRRAMDHAEIIRLYNSGVSEKEVAEKFGVSRAVIRRRLVEEEVPIRGRSPLSCQCIKYPVCCWIC